MIEKSPIDVLMLEEDRALADLARLSLEREGLQTEIISRAVNWLATLEETQPRLVIVDLFLTGQSGLALLQEMKEKGWMERTRVLVLSSLGFREVVKQATHLGALDFIVKPFDVDVFLKRVHRCLRKPNSYIAD